MKRNTLLRAIVLFSASELACMASLAHILADCEKQGCHAVTAASISSAECAGYKPAQAMRLYGQASNDIKVDSSGTKKTALSRCDCLTSDCSDPSRYISTTTVDEKSCSFKMNVQLCTCKTE